MTQKMYTFAMSIKNIFLLQSINIQKKCSSFKLFSFFAIFTDIVYNFFELNFNQFRLLLNEEKNNDKE